MLIGFRRKNSGFDDSFDAMGNNMSSTPSKNQSKKEDENCDRRRASSARYMRRQSRETNYVLPANKGLVLFGNTNSISEENQTGHVNSGKSSRALYISLQEVLRLLRK